MGKQLSDGEEFSNSLQQEAAQTTSGISGWLYLSFLPEGHGSTLLYLQTINIIFAWNLVQEVT